MASSQRRQELINLWHKCPTGKSLRITVPEMLSGRNGIERDTGGILQGESCDAVAEMRQEPLVKDMQAMGYKKSPGLYDKFTFVLFRSGRHPNM